VGLVGSGDAHIEFDGLVIPFIYACNFTEDSPQDHHHVAREQLLLAAFEVSGGPVDLIRPNQLLLKM
jgi:hypothetical protein